jgi:hypothetical protein
VELHPPVASVTPKQLEGLVDADPRIVRSSRKAVASFGSPTAGSDV